MQNLALNDEDTYNFATDFKPDDGQIITEFANQFGTQSNNIFSGLEALGDDDEYGEASSDEVDDDDGTGEYIPNEEGEMDE